MERRAHPRTNVELTARVAAMSEHIPPPVTVIDVTLSGALVAFSQPIGFSAGERVVVSLDIVGEPVHLLGRVVRTARGEDFRSYVAIHFDDDQPRETERLQRVIDDSVDARDS